MNIVQEAERIVLSAQGHECCCCPEHICKDNEKCTLCEHSVCAACCWLPGSFVMIAFASASNGNIDVKGAVCPCCLTKLAKWYSENRRSHRG